MTSMTPSRIAAAGVLLVTLLPSSIIAAPLGGLSRRAEAGNPAGFVQLIHDRPMHSGYTRVCNFGPRGWMLRNHRGQLMACRAHRSDDFGWSWREEGGRSGWYHSRDRIWR
jgi:hypothetical protein